LDVLAGDWLDNIGASVELRRYLVEKLFPTLVMGLERLLVEADKRGELSAVSDDVPHNEDVSAQHAIEGSVFIHPLNPVDFVAQYLMRNNPKYSNFAEASPYMQSLKVIEQELQARAYELSGNRAARLSAEVDRRRKAIEQAQLDTINRHTKLLEPVLARLDAWSDYAGGLETNFLRDTLGSFREYVRTQPIFDQLETLIKEQALFQSISVDVNLFGQSLNSEGLVKLLGPTVQQWPPSLVPVFVSYLETVYGNSNNELEERLLELFDSLPNVVTATRLQEALQNFYDQHAHAPNIVLMRPRANSMDR
jgi:hypothetical protein